MKIIAWNLNHRIREKTIPLRAVDALRHLAPDVLVLTEYVDGESRGAFKRALGDMGLSHITVSEKRDRHNQVLIASRIKHLPSNVQLPSESHGRTNFLPVSFRDPDLTLIGVRAPAYESASDVESYWAELVGILDAASHGNVLVVGDLNGDPDNSRSVGGRYIGRLCGKGWSCPKPAGPWSYISSDGRYTSRIDHVLASAPVKGVTASYIAGIAGVTVAGTADQNPISDHAILLCEVSFPPAQRSEVIVEVLAEGGSITLYGARSPNGWVFSRDVMDQTPELLDEPWIEHSSTRVDSWEAALELLDDYPWHRLSPYKVHKEFRKAVLDEVEKRYAAAASPPYSTLPKWRALCNSPDGDGGKAA
jgi:exonuclease III